MIWRRKPRDPATRPLKKYSLPDSELRAYDCGVGVLSTNGEVRAHLASVVGRVQFPSSQPWPWFVVIWLDGTKEPAFEDYGPGWWTVRELDAGFLDHEGRVYNFSWLSTRDAAEKWRELGLTGSDFRSTGAVTQLVENRALDVFWSAGLPQLVGRDLHFGRELA